MKSAMAYAELNTEPIWERSNVSRVSTLVSWLDHTPRQFQNLFVEEEPHR